MSGLFLNTLNTRPLLKNSLRYIRSDVPDRLSYDEVQWLINNNVTSLVDLRTTAEAAEKPLMWIDNRFKYINLPVSGGSTVPSNAEDVHMSYLKMVDEQMKKIIDYIESSDSNVMYFCNAGKDRTGVVSAILLLHLKTDKSDIISDYLLSAENLRYMLKEYCVRDGNTDIEIITPKYDYMSDFLNKLKLDF